MTDGTTQTELYIWTHTDKNGREGTICMMVSRGSAHGPLALVTRNRAMAEGPMRKAAEEHRRASGHRVRLIRWTKSEDLEDLG
jgi:hypothetical protein